jgi:hypothetical protein
MMGLDKTAGGNFEKSPAPLQGVAEAAAGKAR